MRPVRLALAGAGYRAGMHLRVAARLPEVFEVSGVLARGPAAAQRVAPFGVRVHDGLEGLLADRPDVVVTALPARENERLVAEAVAAGAHVLSETPPAADLDGLRRLWAEVGASARVHVAEQYPSVPFNAARRALVERGLLGEVTSVQVSSTQYHHAAALVRDLLGRPTGPVEVRAVELTAPLADPVGRAGWSGDATPRPLATTIAVLDLGDGRHGLYDFTETQTRNPLRARRTVVRGTLGEVVDERVVRLVDPLTVVESALVRRQTGWHQDVEGFALQHVSLDGEVLWRNRFAPARLNDEEVAVATVLLSAGEHARGEGPGPYPLAQGAQDHLLGLAVREAAATGRPVRTAREAWG
ncbi:Gfo/Idh/MocA family protein [Kineococcus sp. SYSU DK004]|uniref:Gfo/Idh/MocA family protein n=1 Tax=Kineococcus sp. SYSU DK004 TaxID=3383125 RepID=UPI003D7DD757